MSIHIRTLNDVLGAEVLGVDLTQPQNTETREKLNELFAEHAVLVFRDQDLSPPQFMDAVGIFGPLMPQQHKKFTLPDYPMVGYNSTRDLPRKNGKLQVRGENYHTDHSNTPAPPKATALLAKEIPSYGGDTQFVDVRRAFDELGEDLKPTVRGQYSRHVHESSRSPRSFTKLTDEEMALVPSATQPLVIRHPESGRPALYLNTGRMEGVEGMPHDDGYALIEKLYAHATQPRYEYRHKWRVGDLVIWDNRSVMHQANADYDPEEYRYLLRLMVCGEPLLPAVFS